MALVLAGASASADENVHREIVAAASRHGVDPRLVEAIARTESGFNRAALSPKGAMGVMQLMPATARSLGVSDPWDVRENVDGGTRLLKELIMRYGGNLQCALAAYNAGEPAVERLGCRPFEETTLYMELVLAGYHGNSVKRKKTKPAS